nr:MAG TPA: hypothetical protein [Caudoviricetes sp.]
MNRYVKYNQKLLEEIEKQLSSSFPIDYETLKYILYRLKKKENHVIEISVIDDLKKISNFDVKRYIICYYEKESDDIEAVKVRRRAIELVNDKVYNAILDTKLGIKAPFSIREVINLVNSRNENIFSKKNLYRIELLTGMNLRKHILDTMIVMNGNTLMRLLSPEEEFNIMHSVARELSNRYNYGYKLNSQDNSLTVEKGNEIVLYWSKGALRYNKKVVANLFESVKDIGKTINNIMIKESKRGGKNETYSESEDKTNKAL